LDSSDVEKVIQLARVYGFNPAFEGGEAETFVVDAPLFRYRVDVRGMRRKLAPYHIVYEIREARLVPKD
ncbi:MAG TPA: ATP-binding protein, partial [Pyrodictium sp.]|nr:ATP-binding protein [Pyrodictium sp.]